MAKKKKKIEISHKSNKVKFVEKGDGVAAINLPDLKTNIIAAALIILSGFAIYFQTSKFQFVNWDDDRNFYENKLIESIGKNNFWSNTKKIFQTTVIGNYNPLTIWTFAIEKMLWGFDQPGKWHLTNVYMHIICGLLVYKLMLLLGIGWRGALFGSLLFIVHPMRVESVAWVTERKDVLFGMFFLASLLQYILWKKDNKSIRIIWIYLFFILSLLSKIQAVSLPLTFILVDFYMDKKWDLRSVWSKIPYFALSLIVGVLGIYFLAKEGSIGSAENAAPYAFWQRFFVGSYSYMVYLIKLIFPYQMSPLYPYSPKIPGYYYPTMLLVPIILYGLYKAHKAGQKHIVFGVLFFTFNVVFVLQIIGAGQGLLADRFTYIPYIGFFFIGAYYLEKIFTLNASFKTPVVAVSALLVLGYGVMAYNQTKVWENSGTLWTHALKYNSQTTLPYGNRANYYRSIGEKEKALNDYSSALKLKENPQTYNSRARLYFDLAKSRDSLLLALSDYNRAIELKPGDGEFHVNRGATYARLGDFEKALADINLGLQYKPDHAAGYLNRSVIYHQMGDYQRAFDDLVKYTEIDPYKADIWYEMGRAKRLLKRPAESIPYYDKAIQLDPKRGLFYHERAITHFEFGRKDQAKKDMQMAISLGYRNINRQVATNLGINVGM